MSIEVDAGSSAGGSSEAMTVPRFIDNFRLLITHPEGQLAAFAELIKQNDAWICRNRNQLSGGSIWDSCKGIICSQNNLTEGDMMEVVMFMRFCHEESDASTQEARQEARQAVYQLYRMLVNLSSSDRMREMYYRVGLVEAVCQHLSSVQAHYTQDELLGKIVEWGLPIICNCADGVSSSLRPTVRQQAGPTLRLYSDPQSNSAHKVIDAVETLEVLEAEEELRDRTWPDSVFEAVTDLVQRSQHDQELQYYRARYNDGADSGVAASSLMICLTGLDRAQGHTCKVVTCLSDCKEKIKDFLKYGHEADQCHTRALLERVRNHTCSQCGDAEWITRLLKGTR